MRTLRTYIAGLGSAGSLLGAVAAAFIAIGAIVAFEGLPGASTMPDSGAILVQTTNAPEVAAATALGPGVAPPADAPITPPEPAVAPAAAVPAAPAAPDLTVPPSVAPPVDPPDRTDPPDPPDPPAPPAALRGDTAGVVEELDGAVNSLAGADLDLGGKLKGLTDLLDGTLKGITGGKGLGLGRVRLPDLPPLLDLSGLNGLNGLLNTANDGR